MARSYERTRAHATISTRNPRKKAERDAEAARLSAQYGLGDCTDSWDLSGFLTRVVLGWILILLVALAGDRLAGADACQRADDEAPAGVRRFPGGWPAAGSHSAAVAAGAAVPVRRRHCPGEQPGRRLVVLPWGDLDTLSMRVVSGYDGDYVAGCALHSRSGATLTLGRKGDPFHGKEAIMTAAEQEIASHRVGPLTHLLDTGQPVIIGSLTVDQLGVSARGRWQVSWQQARQVTIRLHGQRVLVKVGRLGSSARPWTACRTPSSPAMSSSTRPGRPACRWTWNKRASQSKRDTRGKK